MAIKAYEKNGNVLYQVYVCAINKEKKIRIQKLKKSIKTLADARREEGKLQKICYEEVNRIGGKGFLWKEIINRWVINMRNRRFVKKY
jgi:hypothetical protein